MMNDCMRVCVCVFVSFRKYVIKTHMHTIHVPLLSTISLVSRCRSIIAFFARSPWYATFEIFRVFCFNRNVSGSSATCVTLPFCFSKSAWYFTFDCIFVFSAIRFNSGVSAIVVAFTFGICLEWEEAGKKLVGGRSYVAIMHHHGEIIICMCVCVHNGIPSALIMDFLLHSISQPCMWLQEIEWVQN